MNEIKNEEARRDYRDMEKVSDLLLNRVWEITKELNENFRHYN
jgi:hypothetical protein